MLEYSDKCFCKKCGKPLPYYNHEYTYSHDYSIETDVVKRVKRDNAKLVGLSDFYCNECYAEIPNEEIISIVESAQKFIDEDIQKAIDEITIVFENKLNKINQLREYVQKGIDLLSGKKVLNDLSNEDIEYLMERCYLYHPECQDIKPGFCYFELAADAREMPKIRESEANQS